MVTGIRELKDNLSRYIRRVESGERIAVTAHRRVVAEIVPPGSAPRQSTASRDSAQRIEDLRPPRCLREALAHGYDLT